MILSKLKLGYRALLQVATSQVFIFWLLVLITVANVYHITLGKKGILYTAVVKKEIASIEHTILSLQDEIKKLKNEIYAIQSKNNLDLRYEDYARRNLGMVKKNELFIQLYNLDEQPTSRRP
ncbi:MAG: septum formation initiator family protein [Methylacidiphilales bacterium]|nr:septum formation initiator family protein [Candidatus Methylacidiphilales bacterium]